MLFRYVLIFIATILVIRIVRGVWKRLFPPVGTQDTTGQNSFPRRKSSQKIDYKDVKDAEFKDV
jgi:hypothetical protein